jgi:hypothetical protein
MRKRISIAAIVNRLHNLETGESIYLGFANKGAFVKNGELLFTALAGGTLAWPEGENYLLDNFQADFCDAEREDGGIDLRFLVDVDISEDVISEFVFPNPSLFESPALCIEREVRGELSTVEIKGLQSEPVLSGAETDEIQFVPIGSYRQPEPEDGQGTSANSTKEGTKRLFYVFDMYVNNEVWLKMNGSHICRFFTAEEASLTGGGRRKAILADGTIIGDNIFEM